MKEGLTRDILNAMTNMLDMEQLEYLNNILIQKFYDVKISNESRELIPCRAANYRRNNR